MNIKLIFTIFISSGFFYNSHDLLSHNHTQNPFINSAKYLFWHVQSVKYRYTVGEFSMKRFISVGKDPMIIIIIFSPPYFILINCPKYSLGLRWGASGEVVVARSVINVRMMNRCPGINSHHDMRLQSLTYSPTRQSIIRIFYSVSNCSILSAHTVAIFHVLQQEV